MAERARLSADVLAALYGAAEVTIRQASVSGGFRTSLLLLAQSTETAALIPATRRGSALGCLSLSSADPTLAGVLSRWARTAGREFAGQTRLTSFAFQSTAALTAMLCSRTAEAAGPAQQRNPQDRTPEALRRSFAAWRTVSSWPAHVRLAGAASSELRRSTGALAAALSGPMTSEMHPVARILILQEGLHRAADLGVAQIDALSNIVRGRQMWVAAESVSPRYLSAHPEIRPTGWIPDPGGRVGLQMVADAIQARELLDGAIQLLDRAVGPLSSMSPRGIGLAPIDGGRAHAWEVVASAGNRPEEERSTPGVGLRGTTPPIGNLTARRTPRGVHGHQ